MKQTRYIGEHTVEIERNAATGKVTLEKWYRRGKLDRDDGPAIIERHPVTGAVLFEVWYKEGKPIEPPLRVI